MSEFKFKMKGAKKLKKQLSLLMLSPRDKQRYHYMFANAVAFHTRKRVRSQQSLAGGSFKKSQSGKKVFRRISLSKFMKVSADVEKGVIGWPDDIAGEIARRHQDGVNEKVTSKSAAKKDSGSNKGNCTANQAFALVQLGYTRPLKSGKRKPATISWLKKNISESQAGAIIRSMRGTGKQTWSQDIPARPFLGVTNKERHKISQEVLDRMTQKVKRRT